MDREDSGTGSLPRRHQGGYIVTTQVQPNARSIKEYFAELPDPRSSINRLHLLVDVVVISLCGVLAGADGPEAIEEWAVAQEEWLRQHLELPNGIPSHDTFGRFLERVDPQAFQRCFAAWIGSLSTDTADGVRLLAVDGKTLRRSHDRQRRLGPLHLVSVWASEQGLTLAQIATEEKSNEITAIPLVLELVDLKGAVVTIDAMGCQKAIAQKIIDRGGDYVLPVKGNQDHLQQAVETLFDEHLEDDFARLNVSRIETEEQGHGRLERRTYLQVNVPKTLAGREDWAGLRTLGLVIRTRDTNGKETGDVQCYISSLKRNAKLFARAVRSHWSIENTCHWTLDMTFREDDSRVRERRLTESLAWLRRFALGLLKQHPAKKSLAMKRRIAGWNADFLSEVLFNKTS
jgi:predicted transposase YbfD/YdcC